MKNNFSYAVENAIRKHSKRSEIVNSIKKNFKEMKRDSLMKLFKSKILLDSAKIERGKIYIVDVCKLDGYTISILKMCPNSKIKWHMHDQDEEYYIFWKEDGKQYCPKGCGHELENVGAESIYVLSIKIVVD